EGRLRARRRRSSAASVRPPADGQTCSPQWPQPQEPPQQPPPAPVGPAKLGALLAPWTAKVESCFSTFPAPHSGHVTACSTLGTSRRGAGSASCNRRPARSGLTGCCRRSKRRQKEPRFLL